MRFHLAPPRACSGCCSAGGYLNPGAFQFVGGTEDDIAFKNRNPVSNLICDRHPAVERRPYVDRLVGSSGRNLINGYDGFGMLTGQIYRVQMDVIGAWVETNLPGGPVDYTAGILLRGHCGEIAEFSNT